MPITPFSESDRIRQKKAQTIYAGYEEHKEAFKQGYPTLAPTLGSQWASDVIPYVEGRHTLPLATQQIIINTEYNPPKVTIPSAPLQVTGVSGPSQITVSWLAPASVGGSPILRYEVTSSPGQILVTTEANVLTAVVTGLTNGVGYTFTVVAINTSGSSPSSLPSPTIIPGSVPSAPTIGTATNLGGGQVQVTWTAPSDDGGAAITQYNVRSNPGNVVVTAGASATSATVSGLSYLNTYTFTVTATNGVGTGAASAASNPVIPYTVPGIATGVSAVPGNTTALVSWTPPTNTGGLAISYYTAISNPGGFSSQTADGTVSSTTITGLTNGTSYTFTVITTNSLGDGLSSAASSSVIPATVPGAPTAVSGVRGNGQVQVSWSAPSSTGGSPITGYVATANDGLGNIFTSSSTTNLTVAVAGLTNGTPYTFTVVATNAVGAGTASSPSAPVTPATIPGAPTSLVGTSGNTQVALTWTPASNGGTPITGYTVTSSPGSFTATTTGATTATVTGLTNGQAYTFTVTATNSVGTSTPSAASPSVTPATVPGAPTAVSGVRGDGLVTASWSAPSDTGGSPITGYVAIVLDASGNTFQSVSTTNLTIQVAGLTNGRSCTITVVATNSAGSSIPSSPSAPVTPATIPNPPTTVTGVRGNQEVQVSWLAPSDTGGSPITGYVATGTDGLGNTFTSSSTTNLTIAVTGLTNGTPYTFTVVATNSVGSSVASTASAPVTPATLPGTPTNVTGTPGNQQASIAWTASSSGGSPITNYRVLSSPGGFFTDVSGTTAIVTGLTNGTSYTFTVTATNATGTSPPSSPSNTVTPAVSSDPPTNVTGVRGNGQVQVSWTAPFNTGGQPITSYTVTSSPGGFTATTPNGTTTTIPVTGLTNGTPYTFTVTATTIAGTSSPSVASSAVTPSTVPGAPTSVIATPGNVQASVSWTAPASDGGATITGYTVTSSPGSFTATTTGATTATVTGLTNGTSYTFTVTATNVAGTSVASAASPSVIPATVPGAPTGASGTSGNTQATISWTAPVSNGGSAITSYTVTSTPGSFTATTPDGVTTTATVTGLTNGTSYTFAVVATNIVGSSSAATTASIIPSTVPDAPTGVSGVRGNTEVTVSWSAPASTGGSVITGYTVTSSPGSFTATTTGATTAIVTGLTNGQAYTFTVIASNLKGDSVPSTASSSVTPSTVPGAPTSVVATPGNVQASVTWTAPVSDGGATITGYTVTSSPGSFTATTTGATTATVTGLTNGTSYTFTVTATNVAGTSVASAASAAVIPAVVPTAPTSVTGVRGNQQVAVSWTASSNGGSPILFYTVTSSPGGFTAQTANGSTTTATVTGLSNGTAYTFTVTATNGVGTSSASSASTSYTPATVPDAPTNVTGTAGNTQAVINWTAPFNQGSIITGYTVTSSPGSFTATSIGATTATVTGLTNGTSYTFTVTATNAIGTGSPSTPSSAVIPATVPDAPTAVSGVIGNQQVQVSWSAPANGGSVILTYTATSSPGGFTATTVSGSGATTVAVTGLTNGTSYTFTVAATNSVGTGASSTASTSYIPATIPNAPLGVSASPGDTQALVTWLPANNQGSAITNYTATGFDPVGTPTLSYPTGSGSITQVIVQGLTNGVAYTFTVTATNALGTSSASTPTSAVTPIPGIPSSPQSVSAEPYIGFIATTWSAPSSSGTSAISSYTVTATDPSGTAFTATTPSGTPVTTNVTGLAYGVTYGVTVYATNASGNSLPSTPISITVLNFPVNFLALATTSADTGTTPQTVTTNGSTPFTTIGGQQCCYYNNATGPYGNYMSFPFIIPQTTSCSFSFWVYVQNFGYYNPWSLSIASPPTSYGINPDLFPGSAQALTFNVQTSGGAPNIPTVTMASTTGAWHFFALTVSFSGSTGTYTTYYNGTQKTSATGTGRIINSNNVILGRDGSGARGYDGYIRNFAVYNYALPAYLVSRIYTNNFN